MTATTITPAHLEALLAQRGGGLTQRAVQLLRSTSGNEPIAVTRFNAGSARDTFQVKYEAVRERGIPVHGLDELVLALDGIEAQWVRGCALTSPGEFAVVFMDDDMSGVEAVLVVDA